jgi:hypothetical protein
MAMSFWVSAPWRWRQYVSPKRWHLPTSIHGARTEIVVIVAFRTSNLTVCFVKPRRHKWKDHLTLQEVGWTWFQWFAVFHAGRPPYFLSRYCNGSAVCSSRLQRSVEVGGTTDACRHCFVAVLHCGLSFYSCRAINMRLSGFTCCTSDGLATLW